MQISRVKEYIGKDVLIQLFNDIGCVNGILEYDKNSPQKFHIGKTYFNASDVNSCLESHYNTLLDWVKNSNTKVEYDDAEEEIHKTKFVLKAITGMQYRKLLSILKEERDKKFGCNYKHSFPSKYWDE